MAWLEAIYQPTTLFSLRPSWTTSSGGKTLVLPSPYALKMAVLDAAIRASGLNMAEKSWPWIRDLGIGIKLSRQIVVTNTFIRILRVKEIKTKASEKEAAIAKSKADGNWPFTRTIGYREFVYYPDPISLSFGVPNEQVAQLSDWLGQISHLGKRGGFVQLLAPPRTVMDESEFILLTTEASRFPIDGMVQQLDDCDPQMKFEEANIYETRKPKRIMRHIILPYRIIRSSRSYSLYGYTGA